MAQTPMMNQYQEIKQKNQDAFLFFRLGDFYEMFGPDAIEASKILNITLTARNKGTENETPMCGVPHHSVNNYIYKLTKAGKKVAICEQTSDPNLPGIVKREVVRIITPGTTLDDNVLNNKENNYLISLIESENRFGVSFVDLTTGEFKIFETQSIDELITEIQKINPSEIIASEDFVNNNSLLTEKLKGFSIINKYQEPASYIQPDARLKEHFKVKSLSSFGVEVYPKAVKAASQLISYLKETQKTSLNHINKISYHNITDYMILDEATIRNLELFQTSFRNEYQGSLLSILDKTLTAMGGRLLRQWILRPLINKEKIQEKIEAVNDFFHDFELKEDLIPILKNIADFERLVAKLGCFRANPRDLIALKQSVFQIPYLKQILSKCNSKLLKKFCDNLVVLKELEDLIDRAINDDPPISITEGNIIKRGYNQEIDDLRAIATQGKDWIAEFQAKEIARSGINTLKVKFNKVFGYYIEISKSNLSQVPMDYTRKQTLVNAERFTTPELKEYEDKVLGAEEKLSELEYKEFFKICEKISAYFEPIQANAVIIAKVDVLLNFAIVALNNNYVAPQITDNSVINIKNGRHPVIEQINKEKDFIPNDALLDHQENQLILLTGPNMSGKSSYLRQIALLTLMAQIGSFVPAESMEFGVVDRIFTRVGASDNLVSGLSTFMVEMEEAANILNNATAKSLIIFDELGRGTSTYDGLAIAWAIIEFIQQNIGAKTLFATHYHELIDLVEKMPKSANYSVSVLEKEDHVVFLHKVVKGGMDKSYGIEVAKLVGLPQELIKSAESHLNSFENEKNQDKGQIILETGQVNKNSVQEENQVEKAIKSLDLNNITPLDLVNKIREIRAEIDADD